MPVSLVILIVAVALVVTAFVVMLAVLCLMKRKKKYQSSDGGTVYINACMINNFTVDDNLVLNVFSIFVLKILRRGHQLTIPLRIYFMQFLSHLQLLTHVE